jgi:hypothetical protein
VFFMGAALMGCASSSGPPPLAMTSLASGVGAPPAGQSRIVVIRPENGFMGWGDRGLPIALDGQPMGELLTGNYLSADRPAGPHQLSAELWDMPGVSRHDFTTAPGRTYYFAVKPKQKVNDVAAAALMVGMVGYAVAATVTNDGTGPIDLIPLSEADARRAIAAAPQQ